MNKRYSLLLLSLLSLLLLLLLSLALTGSITPKADDLNYTLNNEAKMHIDFEAQSSFIQNTKMAAGMWEIIHELDNMSKKSLDEEFSSEYYRYITLYFDSSLELIDKRIDEIKSNDRKYSTEAFDNGQELIAEIFGLLFNDNKTNSDIENALEVIKRNAAKISYYFEDANKMEAYFDCNIDDFDSLLEKQAILSEIRKAQVEKENIANQKEEEKEEE